MKLPKIEYPTYYVTLPISKQEIKYRPFTMREQKVLMLSVEITDKESIFNSICDVIDACCYESSKGFARSLCETDLQILFLNIRGKSAGEVLSPNFKCENIIQTPDPNDPDKIIEKKCQGIVPMEINLMDIHLSEPNISDPEIKKGMIKVNDNIVVKMKPTSAKNLLNYDDKKQDVVALIDLIKNSIDSIFDASGAVYDEFDENEIKEWIGTLPTKSIDKMLMYISNVPRISHVITGKCLMCGKQHKYHITNFYDFFRF